MCDLHNLCLFKPNLQKIIMDFFSFSFSLWPASQPLRQRLPYLGCVFPLSFLSSVAVSPLLKRRLSTWHISLLFLFDFCCNSLHISLSLYIYMIYNMNLVCIELIKMKRSTGRSRILRIGGGLLWFGRRTGKYRCNSNQKTPHTHSPLVPSTRNLHHIYIIVPQSIFCTYLYSSNNNNILTAEKKNCRKFRG